MELAPAESKDVLLSADRDGRLGALLECGRAGDDRRR
jgi:hypothetical protein